MLLLVLTAIGLAAPASSSALAFGPTSEPVATVDAATSSSTRIVPDNWGAVYAFYIATPAAGTPQLFVKRRDVGSTTWSAAMQLSSGTVVPPFDVGIDGSSNITVAYREGVTLGRINVRTHLYASDAWGSAIAISHAGPHSTNVRLAVGDNGDMAAVWEHRPTPPDDATIVGSYRPSGLASTWETPDYVSDVVAFASGKSTTLPNVAIDGAGTATAVWIREQPAGETIVETVSRPKAQANAAWGAPVALSSGGTILSARVVANFSGSVHAAWVKRDAVNNSAVWAMTKDAPDADPLAPLPVWPVVADAEQVSASVTEEHNSLQVDEVGNRGFVAVWGRNLDGVVTCAILTRTKLDDGSWTAQDVLAESASPTTGPTFGSPQVRATGSATALAGFNQGSGGVWGAYRTGAGWSAAEQVDAGTTSTLAGVAVVGDWGGIATATPAAAGSSDLRFRPWGTFPTGGGGPTVVAPTSGTLDVSGNSTVVGRSSTMTATSNGTQPITWTYRWERCTGEYVGCVAIPGATGTTYTATSADVGTRLRPVAVASNAAGSYTMSRMLAVTGALLAPTSGTIDVAGDTALGKTLTMTASSNGTTPLTWTHSWQRCTGEYVGCTAIPGATGTSYTTTEEDLGLRLRPMAVSANGAGSYTISRMLGITSRPPAPACATLPPNEDKDLDGLKNWVECSTVVFPDGTGGTLDLPAMGANPMHRDMFLEINSLTGHSLDTGAVSAVVAAFDKAPVTNPDGRNGITMHVDNGPTSTTGPGSRQTWGTLSRSDADVPYDAVLGAFDSPTTKNFIWTEVDAIKSTKFERIRALAFHYVLVGNRYGTSTEGSSGVARAGDWSTDGLGQDVLVTLGMTCTTPPCNGSIDQQAGTLMHEFGHTLGLAHGGRGGTGLPDGENRKPNYPSVMSYNWQFTGLAKTDGTFVLDYSRFDEGDLPNLNELSILEKIAFKASGGAERFKGMRSCSSTSGATTTVSYSAFDPGKAVDWDCNPATTGTKVISSDINRDRPADAVRLTELVARSDWDKLVYTGGSVGAAGAATGTPGIDQMTVDPAVVLPMPAISPNPDKHGDVKYLIASAQAATGDVRKPKVKVTWKRRAAKRQGKAAAKPLAVTVAATDDKGLDSVVVTVGTKRTTTVVKRGTKSTKLLLKLGKGVHVLTVTVYDRTGNAIGTKVRIRVTCPKRGACTG